MPKCQIHCKKSFSVPLSSANFWAKLKNYVCFKARLLRKLKVLDGLELCGIKGLIMSGVRKKYYWFLSKYIENK